ncbi:hypothetical protein chiPu_0025120 [Chiloscyllium punctatum]|uniref:Uncharacterized protein n=1 Tax=Chiloscyllium punctatum TaxID=137246 RepID=A0A401TEL8_CHIPU|nr:hypothetical protein [Chiloscyllium punctatum]
MFSLGQYLTKSNSAKLKRATQCSIPEYTMESNKQITHKNNYSEQWNGAQCWIFTGQGMSEAGVELPGYEGRPVGGYPDTREGRCGVTRIRVRAGVELPGYEGGSVWNYPDTREGRCGVTRIRGRAGVELPGYEGRPVWNYPDMRDARCGVTQIQGMAGVDKQVVYPCPRTPIQLAHTLPSHTLPERV